MPRMSSAERRSAIVAAALQVIVERGVAGATTRAIVAQAGMPLASFHYAFRSRDEMMRELIAFVVDNEQAAAFAAIRVGTDIRNSVRDCLQAYFDLVVADPAQEQVLSELMQYALRTPGLEPLAREQYERYHRAAEDLLSTGAGAADVSWTRPISEIARLVVTVTGGVASAWRADRDSEAAGRVLDLAADAIAALAVPVATRAGVNL